MENHTEKKSHSFDFSVTLERGPQGGLEIPESESP